MAVKELCNTVLRLEKKTQIRLHKPRIRKVLDLLRASSAEETVEEEPPEEIKGLVSGDIAGRDPDARPPRHVVHYMVKYFSSTAVHLFGLDRAYSFQHLQSYIQVQPRATYPSLVARSVCR